MKKFLWALSILVLATSLGAGNSKSSEAELARMNKAQDRAASVFIMPALRNVHYMQPSLARPPLEAAMQQGSPRLTGGQTAVVPPWLFELNQWRRMTGLAAVTENSHLSFGSQQHARYLVVQAPADIAGFRAYDRSIGPRAHTENSHNALYTQVGAEAAIGGALAAEVIQGADVAWEGRSEADDIDELILAPFHRLSLLAPWARVVGYGSFGHYPRRAAALALRGPLAAQIEGRPIEFPPANAELAINSTSGSEWPNPIAGCAGYGRPLGLPITLQTGEPLVLRSYSVQDQSTGEILAVCGFDAISYRNSDRVQQKRGRELLNAYGAAVLIPRNPLSFGHQYRVSLRTSRGSFQWSFGLKHSATVAAAEGRSVVPNLLASRRRYSPELVHRR